MAPAVFKTVVGSSNGSRYVRFVPSPPVSKLLIIPASHRQPDALVKGVYGSRKKLSDSAPTSFSLQLERFRPVRWSAGFGGAIGIQSNSSERAQFLKFASKIDRYRASEAVVISQVGPPQFGFPWLRGASAGRALTALNCECKEG